MKRNTLITQTPVPITWTDISWNKQVRNAKRRMRNAERGESAKPQAPSRIRHHASNPSMSPLTSPVVVLRAFTLIELLVVIAIIAILAAMLLPAITAAKKHAQVTQAKQDIQNIVAAVHKYESDYNRMPLPREIQAAAAAAGSDFTFGTGLPFPGNTPNTNLLTDTTGTKSIPVLAVDTNGVALPNAVQTNNSELIAILMDIENFGNTPTRNAGHVMNTQKTKYLNAKMSNDPRSGGVDPNGVYRDPWGQPYIVTIDANDDGKTLDGFYYNAAVSADPNNPGRGLFGMIPQASGGKTIYQVNEPVIAWSVGPDKAVDPAKTAALPVNKDNVINWQQ